MLAACLAGFWPVAGQTFGERLSQFFLDPPSHARPWVWYRWQGHVTQEGITADLESLAAQGFGGFVLGFSDGSALHGGRIAGNMPFGGAEFFDHVFFTLQEAERLGLQVSVMPMNGWATAGGDWIEPEQREQVLIWDEVRLFGSGRKTFHLHPPLSSNAFYRDIAVLAFPVGSLPLRTAFRTATPEITADMHPVSSSEGKWNVDTQRVADGNPGSFLALEKPEEGHPSDITFRFDAPFSADRLYLHPGPSFLSNLSGAQFRLQVSSDGQGFKDVHTFEFDPFRKQGHAGDLIDFPQAATGTVWRLQLLRQAWPYNAWISELELLQPGEQASVLPRIPFGDARAGGSGRVSRNVLDGYWERDDSAITESRRVIDLTERLRADGSLVWDAPSGNWVVARIGCTDSGETTSAPTLFSVDQPNWEADKFSAQGATAFLSGFLDKLLDDPRAKPFLGSTWVGVQLDSWECSYPLWSKAIPDYWRRTMPYDLQPWMPALLGFTVNSPEETKRFLWDYRRVRADMVGDTFLKTIRDRVHAVGLQLELEMTMFDRFKSFSYGDMPVTEFSPKGDHGGAGRLQKGVQNGVKMTSSAGHLYGNPIISSEAFLAWDRTFEPDHLSVRVQEPDDGIRKFDRDPYALKSAADKAFSQGINRIGLHVVCHQPFVDKLPGITTRYGTNFGRDLIWWKFAHAWTDYLARCQYVLQQGVPEMDFLFCISEDAYSTHAVGSLSDSTYQYTLNSGYDFDFCTGQMVKDLCSVENGRIVTSSGQSYPLLVVGSLREMTWALAEKLSSLVDQGAVVLAPRPSGSPSLADSHSGNDQKLAAVIQKLWGNIDGKTVKSHRFGRGRMLWGYSIEEALREIGAQPAFVCDVASVGFMQRRIGDDRVFFLSSQSDQRINAKCSFAITGKSVEFWSPDRGRIETASDIQVQDGRTIIPIQFDPNHSVFVVFREKPSAGAICGVTRDACDQQVLGPWQVSFVSPFGKTADTVFDSLELWAECDDPFVKYFSGSAVYSTQFEVAEIESATGRSQQPIWLDLGDVWNLAQVSVNGKKFSPLWKPPFCLDITESVIAGVNELKIEVVNTWVNHLIGDLNLPPAERKSWLTVNPHTKNSPLRPSGLLGPVKMNVPLKTK